MSARASLVSSLLAAGTLLTVLAAGGPADRPEAGVPASPCTTCHGGIVADTSAFGELSFPHAPHVGLEDGCLRCHGEHGDDGGAAGVTVETADCRDCHHGPARRDAALCERCHEQIFAASVTYEGRPFNHSVHVGPFTGLGCVACHGETSEPVVASPPRSACVACHP